VKHCRRGSDEIDVQLYLQVKDIPVQWDELLPADHFLHTEQLVVSEQAKLPDVTFLYALISVDNIPVAASYFQVLHLRNYHLDTAQVKKAQGFLWEKFTAFLKPKLLVAGHLFRHDICSFYWKEAFSPFDAYKFYQAAINTAVKKTRAMAVLVKDMNESLVTYFQNYAPEYLVLRNDINMEMDMDPEWETMLQYEKSLKHKYAQRLRKVRSSWNKLEIKELSAEETLQQKEVIFQLYNKVSQRQLVRLGILSADYLPELKKQHPEELKIWMAYEEGKPVAFFSAWLHQEVLDMFYIGFDYTRNEELQLYFNILFFAVEQAINYRKKTLILGRTALEAKARLGCKAKYLSTFLYIPNGIIRSFVNQVQQNVNDSEGAWENRHPFKKDAQ
jgi:hypothetical protein